MLHGNRPRRGETVKYRELSYLPGTPVSAASGSLGAAIIPFRETRRSRLLGLLALVVMTLGILIPSYGQGTNVINCPSGFTSSGACGVGSGQNFPIFGNGGANLSGSKVILQPTGVVHAPSSIVYQTKVNTQAFSTTFTFVPNGWNLAFVLENSTTDGGAGPTPGYTLASSFSSGAGCEGGFYQAFGGSDNPPPNNIFVLNFDSGNLLVNSLSPFYSNVQIYQQIQSPCIPGDGQPWYYPINKVSTSPVSLNSPATTFQTTTKDTYDATIIYTGTNVVLNMYDVTAGGSCPGSSCFTYTWYGVNIPSLVDGTSAYLAFGGSTNAASPGPLGIISLVFTDLSPAPIPTFSPSAGMYEGNQNVFISDLNSDATICYNTTGAPATNGQSGCANGTLYTGAAISVPGGESIYAVAGGKGYGDSAIGKSTYKIGLTASQPTFYPAQGTYQGNQTVFLTAAQGSVICYNTTGSPATNGSTGCTTGTLYTGPITVSSNETLYAEAGGTGLTDSAAGSAAYVISPFAVVDGHTGSYPANSPTYSPLPGSYSDSQSVTISTTTSGAYICYIASATPPTLLPETNNLGGCSVGTLYSSPISVTSSETIYAIASTIVGADVPGTGPPSSQTAGIYTIGGGPSVPGMPSGVKANAVPQ
jgi:hypothetical protein